MEVLKLAIQKSGRLSEGTLELIKNCGIKIQQQGKARLMTEASNFPLQVLFLRDDDIPGYVADGVADIGIAGENVIIEKQHTLEVAHRLGFSRCRLSLAIPKAEKWEGPQQLQGQDIATSYPVILQSYLDKHNVQAKIHEISGSVEIAPGIGLASAICDIVSSGSTLFQNNLKEVDVVMKSEAVLVANAQLSSEKRHLLNKLLFRINSIQKAKNSKYILLNAPESALEKIKVLMPGMRSPTVVPLAEKGWVSVHSVIEEEAFWEHIEALRQAGAEGILVIPIEKMIL